MNEIHPQTFHANMNRVSNWVSPILENLVMAQTQLQWQSRSRTLLTYIAYVLFIYFFQLWLLPAALLLLFLVNLYRSLMTTTRRTWNRRSRRAAAGQAAPASKRFEPIDDVDDDLAADEALLWATSATNATPNVKQASKRKNSRLRIIQDFRQKMLLVQWLLGAIGDTIERAESTLRFTVPWLSYLGMVALLAVTVVVYCGHLRGLLIAWTCLHAAQALYSGPPPSFELVSYMARNWTEKQKRVYDNNCWPDRK